jgi:hypothetical protein
VTLDEAINQINRAGSIRAENGKLKLRFPQPERARLEPAIETLRLNREAALEALRTEVADDCHEAAKCALSLLNSIGARIVVFAAGYEATGIWSDLDGPEVRSAIRTLGRGDLPVLYLDSPGCPDHYKVRRVPGETIPLSILTAMEAAASEPWRVRDELLKLIGNKANK